MDNMVPHHRLQTTKSILDTCGHGQTPSDSESYLGDGTGPHTLILESKKARIDRRIGLLMKEMKIFCKPVLES
ncbi:conserved hypothetical protein [Ricinus communis]|uniref:Uncharacterized protein n=1 Tax=Ricinus communis TaxID=3988 RepID=B9SDX1_RICCO|nr:conserved hypothetical protein [Ricinus communis]